MERRALYGLLIEIRFKFHAGIFIPRPLAACPGLAPVGLVNSGKMTQSYSMPKEY
jgi:hypothetical protein